MKHSAKFAVIALVLVVAAAGAYITLPNMWAKAVPGFLNKNIGSFLVVDHSEFVQSPPELILTNVHLKNPAEFGTGDAITIGQINVVFNKYQRNPMDIKTITVQKVSGKQLVRDNVDNFKVIHKMLMDKKVQTPRGTMANTVVLGRFIIHDVRTESADGTIKTALSDKSLTPVSAMANNPPLQNVIVDILGTVIEQQQAGVTPPVIEDLKNEATKTIQSIGDSIKSFLTTP